MKMLGRKIYYNKSSGKVVLDTGEHEGSVVETTKEQDFKEQPSLTNLNPKDYDFIQLGYKERLDEFANIGTMEVKNGGLIIYPNLIISTNKSQILSDGIDNATITVIIDDKENIHPINFEVLGEIHKIETSNGIATIDFSTSITGEFDIVAHNDKYGEGRVNIKGV